MGLVVTVKLVCGGGRGPLVALVLLMIVALVLVGIVMLVLVMVVVLVVVV
jgi:hypothetical protein